MKAEIRYEAKEYWIACRTARRHMGMGLNQMARVETTSDAVRRRVNSFMAQHHRSLPGNSPNGGGGSVA